MFIEKIEIENFKSFKSHTEINLSPNTNLIIGKNGSGKSNIIHAIQIVLCCESLSKQDRIDLIYEGNILTESIATVCLYMNNQELRIEGPKRIKIKRLIGVEKDEYYFNDKLITRKDIIGLIENGGICVSTPYFIIKQGKISAICNLNDKSRFELIKNISGALKYENERQNCVKILEESEITKKKLETNLEIINDKLKNLEKEKLKMEECDKLEIQKRRLEIAYLQIEFNDINIELNNIEVEDNDIDIDIDYELRCVTDKIKNLENERTKIELYFNKKNENYFESENLIDSSDFIGNDVISNGKQLNLTTIPNSKNLFNLNLKNIPKGKNQQEGKKNNCINSQFIKNEIRNLEKNLKRNKQELQEFEEKITKLKNNEKEVFVDKTYLTNVINFMKVFKDHKWSKEEIKQTEELLKEKEKSIYQKSVMSHKSLDKLIEDRKELWREEKKVTNLLKSLKENICDSENKIVVAGNFSYKAYKDIKNIKGIVGCVFDMVKVPDELFTAFEAVAGNFLFNIVVENENIVKTLINKIHGNVVFIPINRMFYKEPKIIEDSSTFLLSSKIECNSEYKTLLNFICRNVYMVSDIETGISISNKYNVNVVTIEGDLINTSGTMTGGYDQRSSTIKKYKKYIEENLVEQNNLRDIKNKISKLNIEIETIERIKNQSDINLGEAEFRKSICKFLEEKIKILQKKGKAQNFYEKILENLSFKSINLRSELIQLESKMDDLKSQIGELETQKIELNQFAEILQRYDIEMKQAQEEFKELKFKESKKYTQNSDLKNHKQNLILKKEELIKKIGMTSIDCINLDKQEIADKLKILNEKLNKFIFLNRKKLDQWGMFIEQKNGFLSRKKELEDNYKNILKFINNLDEKKEEKMNLTFELIKTSFGYFSQKLCNFICSLKVEGDKLIIDLPENDVKGLSGGQKTMVAICLLFSIQKVDSSPFYIFDEIDANLDQESRIKMCRLYKEMEQTEGCQFVITTFKEELVSCGSNFIGVTFSDKKSYASTIDKSVAYNFLVDSSTQ